MTLSKFRYHTFLAVVDCGLANSWLSNWFCFAEREIRKTKSSTETRTFDYLPRFTWLSPLCGCSCIILLHIFLCSHVQVQYLEKTVLSSTLLCNRIEFSRFAFWKWSSMLIQHRRSCSVESAHNVYGTLNSYINTCNVLLQASFPRTRFLCLSGTTHMSSPLRRQGRSQKLMVQVSTHGSIPASTKMACRKTSFFSCDGQEGCRCPDLSFETFEALSIKVSKVALQHML